ncbi:hypothetical protein MCEGE10_01599 [Flavobacteriaceae bacterium]
MKKIIIAAFILSATFVNAQAYKGKKDVKMQIGANIQDGGTGIFVSTDFGIGENMSFGFSGNYLLSTDAVSGSNVEFLDRTDLKVRFNANIGNVFKMDKSMDIYPGLDLGLRNFGAHLGFRYFFTDGFGLFTEAGMPIASYKTKPLLGYEKLNNQFVFNVGMSFNL